MLNNLTKINSANKNITTKHILTFILPSLSGVLLFMIPINFEGSLTLLVAVFAKSIELSLDKYLPAISTLIISLSCLLSIIKTPLLKTEYFKKLFQVGKFWTLIRSLGALFTILAYFKIGPEFIFSDKTGGYILNELLGLLFSVFLFAGLLLPLLLNFGLLEFFGIICGPIMRPFFKLPGRSAIDCLTSCIGDGTIGIVLTNKQYEQGYYTQKEAAIIGTTFSLVSLTFTIVILSIVKLNDYILPYYIAIILSTLAAALICPRVPPLVKKKDIYIDGSPYRGDIDTIPSDKNRITWAFSKACTTASKQKGITCFFIEGIKNILDMWLGILPIVMCFGTLSLIIANYTVFFKLLGAPFIPILNILQIPESNLASQAVVIGFADMFLPVTIAANIKSELTRFVIASLSVTQLIFMSEVGSLLICSKIPINFKELFIIFLQRTLISLPIVSIIAHLTF